MKGNLFKRGTYFDINTHEHIRNQGASRICTKFKKMSNFKKKIKIYYQLIEYFDDAIDDIFEEVEIKVLDKELSNLNRENKSEHEKDIYNYLLAIRTVIAARRTLSETPTRVSDSENFHGLFG